MEIVKANCSDKNSEYRLGEVYYNDGELVLVVIDWKEWSKKYRLLSLDDFHLQEEYYDSLEELKEVAVPFKHMKSKLEIEE